MSGWGLGLVLFGVLLLGWVSGLVSVWAYARHVFKSQRDKFLDGLNTMPVVHPPPRGEGGDLRRGADY